MKPLPRYVCMKRVKRHPYLYFRRGDVYQRLPDNPSSPAFAQRYAEILASWSVQPHRHRDGTVDALIARFKASPRWHELTPATRAGYARDLDRLRPIGDEPVAEVRRRHIRELRDLSGLKPRAADAFVVACGSLFKLAVDEEAIDVNPAHGVDRLARSRPYATWSAEQRAVFEAAMARDAVPEWAARAYRIAGAIGTRRGSLLALTWERFDGRRLRYQAEKGGALVDLACPADLARWLAQRRPADNRGPIVAMPGGQPWQRRTFTRCWRRLLDSIGLDGLHLHGLRHTVGRDLAEAGASEDMIMSVTGHRSAEMVRRYTQAARRRTMGDAAMLLMERTGKPRDQSGKPRNRKRASSA